MEDRDVIMTDAQGNEEVKTSSGKLRLVPESVGNQRNAKMQKVNISFYLRKNVIDGNRGTQKQQEFCQRAVRHHPD